MRGGFTAISARSIAASPLSRASAESAARPQPLAALVLGTSERKAYRLLRESFPRAEVLAHVQLLRFIRLPPNQVREDWLQGAGVLDADLLLTAQTPISGARR